MSFFVAATSRRGRCRWNERARWLYQRHGWVSDELVKNFELDQVTVSEIRYSRQSGP